MVNVPSVVDVPAPAETSAPPHGQIEIRADVTKRQWDDFVRTHPDGTVEHLWGWRHVFEQLFGQHAIYLAAGRGGTIVGVLPLVSFRSLIFGRSLVSLPYANYGGLVTSDREAAQALVNRAVEIAGEQRASHVELRNVAQHLPALPCRQHKVGSRLSLPRTAEALWSALDRKVRNQVRKAQKSGLAVERGGASLLGDFYRVFSENMRDLGTPVFPKALFTHALDVVPGHGHVFVVRHDGVPIAGGVGLGFGRTMLVPWASSLRAHRALCANVLLYWTMLEFAIESGAEVFDFGRSSRGSSTHAFKQQWGAADVELHWEYALRNGGSPPDQGTSNPRMQLMIGAWQRLPLSIANALGPIVIRQVP